jgi:hypothetical protein
MPAMSGSLWRCPVGRSEASGFGTRSARIGLETRPLEVVPEARSLTGIAPRTSAAPSRLPQLLRLSCPDLQAAGSLAGRTGRF